MASEEFQKEVPQEQPSQQVVVLSNASTVAYAPYDTPGNVDMKEFEQIMKTIAHGTKTTESGVSGHVVSDLMKNTDALGKGLDICFLVDCTGSMAWCIDEVKTKVRSILGAISTLHNNAGVNVAFVGYRDYIRETMEKDRYEIQDFVPHSSIDSFQSFLNGIKARSVVGNDACEDVAGGLRLTLGLSWTSFTRLVIHFCDNPAHGMDYHNFPLQNDRKDYWPGGDPQGDKLEDLTKQLYDRNISYYFAAIKPCTAKMARAMQQGYTDGQNVEFKIMDWKDAKTSFTPTVMTSVLSSIKHSHRSMPFVAKRT